MNEVWNLDPIYLGFDDPAFCADVQSAKEKLAAFTAFTGTLANAEPAEALRTGIAMEEELSQLAGKLGLYASLRQSANTRDGEAASQLGRLMAIYSGMAGPEAAFKDWASKLPNLMSSCSLTPSCSKRWPIPAAICCPAGARRSWPGCSCPAAMPGAICRAT